MRFLSIAISLLCLAVPLHAIAKPKPKIAVAPFKGDPDGKIAEAVVDSLAGKDFAVVTPTDVRSEIAKLDLGAKLDARAVRKLSNSLDVVAIVEGTVRKSARKNTVRIAIRRRGQPDISFTVEFKTAASASFHRGVHDEVVKRLDGGESHDEAEEHDEGSIADSDRKRDSADEARDERARKPAADGDSDRKRKPPSDDESAAGRRKRVADATTDDDEAAVRKRKAKRGDRRSTATAIARAGAGASVAQRHLTYDTRSGFTQIPPPVRTTAGAGRVDGEIYPFALLDPGSKLAAVGLAASYDKTFGLSIKIPNFEVRAPIDQSHYSIGARYRFAIGESSTVAVGLDYVRRHYIADRESLMAVVLDAPDVDYTAVAPGVAARVPVTPTITILGGVDGMLMLEAGPIQRRPSFGPATVYGIEGFAGVDVALTTQIGLRVALEYSRIRLSFDGDGEMTSNRDKDMTTQDVNAATDRWIGVAATVGLVY